MPNMVKHLAFSILMVVFCFCADAQKFVVQYATQTPSSFTGDVFLYLSKDDKDPKDGSIGLESFPCFRISVRNIKPNDHVTFDDAAVSFPVALSDI